MSLKIYVCKKVLNEVGALDEAHLILEHERQVVQRSHQHVPVIFLWNEEQIKSQLRRVCNKALAHLFHAGRDQVEYFAEVEDAIFVRSLFALIGRIFHSKVKRIYF